MKPRMVTTSAQTSVLLEMELPLTQLISHQPILILSILIKTFLQDQKNFFRRLIFFPQALQRATFISKQTLTQ
jgi:hypothetical protein